MTLSSIFWGIADFSQSVLFVPFEHVGNIFNYACIIFLGFGGLFYWLNFQRKANAAAKNDPTIRK